MEERMKSLMIDDETHAKFKQYCEENRLILMKELKYVIDNHVYQSQKKNLELIKKTKLSEEI